jgi:ComF family protein
VRPAGSIRRAALRALPAKPPPWQRLVAVNDYRPPLSGLIHQLKFNKRPELAPALARLLLLRIRQRRDLPRPDRIISVPLWQRRQWKRGLIRAICCAAAIRWLGCAWRSDALTRRRRTATQHQLSARLRKQNLKNAFQLELSLQGHHIAIVDDVVTTGSTVAEISRLLLRNGAATVQVWCICRTL